jgi:hypothetical protein
MKKTRTIEEGDVIYFFKNKDRFIITKIEGNNFLLESESNIFNKWINIIKKTNNPPKQ